MSDSMHDLMGGTERFEQSFVEVFPKQQIATLLVPNRGTIQVNTAIAFCWLTYRGIPRKASVDSTENHIGITFRLDRRPFDELTKEGTDRLLDQFRYDLAVWAHSEFFEVVRDLFYQVNTQ